MMRTLAAAGLVALALTGCKGGKDGDVKDTGVTTGSGAATGTGTGAATGTGTGAATGTGTGATTSFNWPATPEAYVYGDVAYLYDVHVPDMDSPADECCRDWGAISKDNINNGTNELDNALANLAVAMNAFGFDLQGTIDATILAGDFVALLDFYNLPAGDGDFKLVFFRGEFDPYTDWYAASTGMGDYWVDRLNFLDPTGTPRAVFGTANVTGDTLAAANGTFEIAMPLTDTGILILPLQDVSIDGDIVRGANGIQIPDGRLSGYVTKDDFYAAYNDVVNQLCGCANLGGDLFTNPGTGWVGDCQDVSAICTAPAEDICPMLIGGNVFQGELCAALPLALNGAADLDLNADPSNFEGLSAGLRVQAHEGEILGLVVP